MKMIYMKPLTEIVTLNTVGTVMWGEEAQGNSYDHNDANDSFFDEEEIDDDYDPFFDEE